jgi:hypothetical protein
LFKAELELDVLTGNMVNGIKEEKRKNKDLGVLCLE